MKIGAQGYHAGKAWLCICVGVEPPFSKSWIRHSHVYTHLHTYTCTHTHTDTHTDAHTRTHTHMHAYANAQIQVELLAICSNTAIGENLNWKISVLYGLYGTCTHT